MSRPRPCPRQGVTKTDDTKVHLGRGTTQAIHFKHCDIQQTKPRPSTPAPHISVLATKPARSQDQTSDGHWPLLLKYA